AQLARLVEVAPTPLDAHRFGNGDFNVGNMVLVPLRLEQAVGETQRNQVLNGFLAQIVIDPVDATFREILRDGLVDDARRGQVVADGLLQHHARLLGQPRRGKVFADRPVYRRWRGEVGDQRNSGW